MKSDYQNDYWRPQSDSESMNEQFERFELLSAYLDGEVTTEERYQIQEWIDNDYEFKQNYLKLLRLQQEIPQIPTPTPSISADKISQRVFQQINQEKQRLRFLFLGGMTVAAIGIAAISSVFMGNANPFQPSIQTASLEVESEPLMIALNKPVFEMPVDQ